MTAGNILAAVLAAIFAVVGAAKVLRARPLVTDFDRFGYPTWSLYGTGAAELIGAVLLVLGIPVGSVARDLGAALLIIVMLGALATHLRVHDHADKVTPPVILGLLLFGTILLGA